MSCRLRFCVLQLISWLFDISLRVLPDRKFSKHTPTWQNLMYMETFLATLQPLSTLTDALSNTNSVSICNVHPTIESVKRSCQNPITIDVPDEYKAISKAIQSDIWTYIHDKWVSWADDYPIYKSVLREVLLEKIMLSPCASSRVFFFVIIQ